LLEINKIENKWTDELPAGITWYFIGQPKSGKTTQAASWSKKGSEGVLIIDTDLGADFVDGANVITCSSLNAPTRVKEKDGIKILKNGKEVLEIIPPIERGFYFRSGPNRGEPMPAYSLAEILQDLQKNWDKYPYDTIVIDTIDQVNSWIEEVVKADQGIENMGDGSWGADWAAAKKKNADIVKRLQDFLKKVGGNLVLCSHAKQTAMTDDKVQLSPNLPSGLGRVLCAKADVIGYATIDKENGEYLISFQGYDERMVGSRLKPLAQKLLPFSYTSVINEIKSYKEEKGAK
tara:strand:- start:10735 stop:11607 length:873 start_codon:yes stop_codon:yes gene_type:complete